MENKDRTMSFTMYVSQMYFKNFTFGGLSFEDSSTLCTTSEETSGSGLLFSYRHIRMGNLQTHTADLHYPLQLMNYSFAVLVRF